MKKLKGYFGLIFKLVLRKNKHIKWKRLIGKKIYLLLWIIRSAILPDKVPVFILLNDLHYVMIKNILPHLKSYRLYPLTSTARVYLDKINVKYSLFISFPKYIIETEFISETCAAYLPISLEVLYGLNQVKRIQLYHGVVDKNWTYSDLNNEYDLLLVPGQYAQARLTGIGISREKIKVIGYPKFDTYFRNRQKKYKRTGIKPTILYAPTWGILSSLPFMLGKIIELSKKYNVIFKPHYYTEYYYISMLKNYHVKIADDPDITKYFYQSDLMISDTSSAMFEFLITGKPVIIIDLQLWLDKGVGSNSPQGPEIQARNYFYRVKNLNELESVINKCLMKPYPHPPAFLGSLFKNSKNAGKRASQEILEFIKLDCGK